jgi:pilus assembly protein CpaF
VAVFSVIISEKGGAERRETYDRGEINVGRVQGNDLMLPKGNVSKRHARLLCRDGRFIVTDLKSTNGTYVNGRKIAQATIVREGDKIYIGDFVLRIEPGNGGGGSQGGGSLSTDDGAALINPASSMPPEAPRQTSPPAAGPFQPITSANLPSAAALLGASPFAPPTPFAGQVAVDARANEPPSSSQPSSAAEKALRPPSPRIEPAPPAGRPSVDPRTGDRHEVISHFPLEHDPDESVHFAVPGPPRVPSGPGQALAPRPPLDGKSGAPRPMPAGQPAASPMPEADPLGPRLRPSAPLPDLRTTPPRPVIPQPAAILPPGPAPLDRPTSPSVGLGALVQEADAAARPRPTFPAPSGVTAIPPPRRPLPSSPLEGETGRARVTAPPAAPPTAEGKTGDPVRLAQHRAALAALVDRVGELVDLRPLAEGAPADEALAGRVDRALADAVGALRGEIDADTLVAEARRELLELGPLTPLLDDEDVSEIQVVRHDHVVSIHGHRQVPSEIGFTSEAAVGRAVRRLCQTAGRPLSSGETYVERRLPRGARLFAVLPRAEDSGHMIALRKPQRADLSLEDLVRSGTISRAMAGLFTQCVAARANILVTGAEGAGATTLLGALAGAGSTDDRVVVLQEDDELIFNQPHTISFLLGDTPEEGARAVQAAARVRPDRLVVGAFSGGIAAELVDAMGDGVDGVLAGARAPTLRQAVLRLTADIAAGKPGLVPEVAREWLASVFDLAIEVARLRDGRHRVLRVSELAVEGQRIVLRDVFAFNVERTAAGGAIEGTFAPTGVVPGIIEDLAARGVAVDPSIFRRHAKP